ncbi:MAG: YkgJ family cysteine cluster protein [Hyphomicrobiaceae bacterium]
MPEQASRQQRRQIERERIKAGRALASSGLIAKPPREAMRDVASLLRSTLADKRNAQRAGDAAALAHALMETSLARQPGRAEIACSKGCSYCCYTFVGATPPEIFRLADAIRHGKVAGVTPDLVRERAVETRSLPPDARTGAKIACPLLVDNACAAYSERPLVCRQTTSISLPACKDEFEGLGSDKAAMAVSTAHLAHASNAHVALLAALYSAGLPATAYELASALDVALATPDGERSWLAGEDIFRDLPQRAPPPAIVHTVARQIASDLEA